jgi:ankyrin repeat protein
VKLLLRRGADVDVLNKANKTAAEMASEVDNAEVAKLIAEYKADANLRSKIRSATLDTAEYGADEGKGLLHAAVEEGNIDTMKSLFERGININDRNEYHQTPMFRAAYKGNLDVVRLLIEQGAEVNSSDNKGWTPLHVASQSGHLEVSRVLVDHGANVNARQDNHWTPIHFSVFDGHLGIVKLLLEHGADVHALNGDGQTPYQQSLQSGNREIADLLRKHGAGKARFETLYGVTVLRCLTGTLILVFGDRLTA